MDDYIDYLFSSISFPAVCPCGREELKTILERDMVDGVLHIPKDVGMFVCAARVFAAGNENYSGLQDVQSRM